MTVTTLPGVEIALAEHVQEWLNDYLGTQEVRQGLRRGTTKRIPKGATGWKRTEDWPVNDIKSTPCAYVVSRGFAEGSFTRRPNVGVLQAEVVVDFVVVCGAGAATSFDIGVHPRVYLGALVELFTCEPAFGDSMAVKAIRTAFVENLPDASNGDHLAACILSLAVDAPVSKLSRPFDVDPKPATAPRVPEEPVLSETEVIHVEAT